MLSNNPLNVGWYCALPDLLPAAGRVVALRNDGKLAALAEGFLLQGLC